MDHLEGKVFVDYLSDLKRERIRKKLDKDRKERASSRRRFHRRARLLKRPSRLQKPSGEPHDPSANRLCGHSAIRPARAARAALVSAHRVVGVLTQPDRPAGRGRELRCVARQTTRARRAGVPLAQPASLKTAESRVELVGLGARMSWWSSPMG